MNESACPDRGGKMFKAKVRSLGNSTIMVIPVDYAERYGVREGDVVKMKVKVIADGHVWEGMSVAQRMGGTDTCCKLQGMSSVYWGFSAYATAEKSDVKEWFERGKEGLDLEGLG